MSEHMKSAESLLTEVEATYQSMTLGFTGPKYWQALRLTYRRTIADVLALAAEVQGLAGRGSRPGSVLASLNAPLARRPGMARSLGPAPSLLVLDGPRSRESSTALRARGAAAEAMLKLTP